MIVKRSIKSKLKMFSISTSIFYPQPIYCWKPHERAVHLVDALHRNVVDLEKSFAS